MWQRQACCEVKEVAFICFFTLCFAFLLRPHVVLVMWVRWALNGLGVGIRSQEDSEIVFFIYIAENNMRKSFRKEWRRETGTFVFYQQSRNFSVFSQHQGKRKKNPPTRAFLFCLGGTAFSAILSGVEVRLLTRFQNRVKKKKWDFGEKPGLEKKKKNGICQFWEKIDFFWYLARASESDQKWPHEQSDPVTARTRLN